MDDMPVLSGTERMNSIYASLTSSPNLVFLDWISSSVKFDCSALISATISACKQIT